MEIGRQSDTTGINTISELGQRPEFVNLRQQSLASTAIN